MDEPRFELETNRIEALSDGVFAIAMTLLILELKVPVLRGDAEISELPASVAALWPKFLGYAISFVTLGVYWVAHHLHFFTIRRADRMLLWINILFLMTISIVPFTTALLGEYPRHILPVTVYAVNMIAVGLALQLHWSYATSGHRLIDKTVKPELIRSVSHVILMGPAVYLVAIVLAFVNTWISIILFLLVNLLYILPGSVHMHLRHGGARKSD